MINEISNTCLKGKLLQVKGTTKTIVKKKSAIVSHPTSSLETSHTHPIYLPAYCTIIAVLNYFYHLSRVFFGGDGGVMSYDYDCAMRGGAKLYVDDCLHREWGAENFNFVLHNILIEP